MLNFGHFSKEFTTTLTIVGKECFHAYFGSCPLPTYLLICLLTYLSFVLKLCTFKFSSCRYDIRYEQFDGKIILHLSFGAQYMNIN